MAETTEQIFDRMLSNISDKYDKTEGQFIVDASKTIAIEWSKSSEERDKIATKLFPQTSYDEWLDLWVEAHGMARKLGTKATSESPAVFTCETGVLIPKDTVVISDTGLRFLTVADVVGVNGSASVDLIAENIGAKYNVPANSIKTIAFTINGVYSVNNPSPMVGGTDRETDDELRDRFFEQLANPNLGGADRDYIRWAKEVEGVFDVKVIPEWEGFGTNSVKVVVYGENGDSLDSTIVQNVIDHIVSPNDRTKRLAPSSAVVTIVTSTNVNLDITINSLSIKSGYTLASVRASIQSNLNSYIASIKPGETVVIKSLEAVIMDTEGVYDFASITVNGGTSNIPTTDEEKAKLGAITYV
ncbi:baseplate J/gp47 family protein [Brevibacillus agri]|uniref:baseplate J/gp47 family protein n=1 Tax=Brevibacillus agri TaxID=51101 RepID=UPI0025B72311|nr:baseplate J/gp47 family protein [Brevibacillus agri]MDN4093582.1 baseplate J/gp47 family protein [Brevibacillus agri]